LRLTREQGVGEALAAAAAVAFAAGSVLGSAVTDRLVARYGRRRVLIASAALCATALIANSEMEAAIASCLALFVVGLLAAPHHALAQASAYEELPGNPGTVQAVAQLFVLVDILAPLAFGFIADRCGLREAILCLILQPLVVGSCAML
jgi:MFS family permease